MTISLIRPNAEWRTQGVTTPSPSAWQALSDNTGIATYVDFNPGSYNEVVLNLAGVDPTFNSPIDLTADQRVYACRANASFSTSLPIDFFVNFYNRSGIDSRYSHYVNASPNAQDFLGHWISERPGGGEWTQQALDGMLVRIWDGNRNPGKPRVYEVWVEVDIRARATVVVTAPAGAPGTRSPVVTWTFTDPDAGAQNAYQVKVFTQTDTTDPGFDPDLWPPTVDSGIVATSLKLYKITQQLPDETYVAYVRASKDHLGDQWFSAWDAGASFTIDSTPTVPTAVTPAGGSTVNTDIPVLGATVTAHPLGIEARIEWQLATDAAFTVDVKNYTEPVDAQRLSGATTAQLSVPNQLHQTVWYLRARQVHEDGLTGAWTVTQSFTVSHPPTTAGWSPTGGSMLSFGTRGSVGLEWDFQDTSPTDFQTAYHVIVETSGGAPVFNTGKLAGSTGRARVTIPASLKDTDLRWRVMVWDSDDVASAFSANQTFRVVDPPTVAIVAPVGVTTSSGPLIDWTFAASSGRTQTHYRVILKLDGASYLDTNWVASATTQYDLPDPTLLNNRTYQLTVLVRDSALIENQAGSTFETGYAGATVPAFTVDSTTWDDGYVTVEWTDAAQDGDWSAWRVYRLREGADEPELAYETSVDQASYAWQDWLAGGSAEYFVVQVAFRGGIEQESLMSNGLVVMLGSGDYWLIHPTDSGLNVRLHQVVSDRLSDEFEEEVLDVIDRGRKVDYGTHFGVTGQLEIQLRDITGTYTAREQKKKIEALKASQAVVYLRTPFGDVWSVSTGNLDFARMAGVGGREFGTLSVPYVEVS